MGCVASRSKGICFCMGSGPQGPDCGEHSGPVGACGEGPKLGFLVKTRAGGAKTRRNPGDRRPLIGKTPNEPAPQNASKNRPPDTPTKERERERDTPPKNKHGQIIRHGLLTMRERYLCDFSGCRPTFPCSDWPKPGRTCSDSADSNVRIRSNASRTWPNPPHFGRVQPKFRRSGANFDRVAPNPINFTPSHAEESAAFEWTA